MKLNMAKDRYPEYPFNGITKKGSGNIGRDGPSISKFGSSLINNNGCTDPKSAITRVSLRIGNEHFFSNYKGLLKQGELEVKTQRNYDETGIFHKGQYIALKQGVDPKNDWSVDPDAMDSKKYICSQFSCCNNRGWGIIYTHDFRFIEYKTILEIAEKDKDLALDILGFNNGNVGCLENLFKKVVKSSSQKR